MKPLVVVVDASVLVACLLKDGRTRDVLFSHPAVQFVAPAFVLDELDALRARLTSKRDVPPNAFDIVLGELRARVQVVASEAYAAQRPEAQRRTRKAHAWGDDEYVALAMALDAPVWTFDDDFDRIEGVRRITADEIERG